MTPMSLTVDPVLGAIILALLGGVGWGVKWVAGRIPPAVSPAAQVAALDVKLDKVEARHDMEIGALKDEISEERTARRGLEDYVEVLRKHISDGNPPPPPPWPEGLRR